MSSSLVLSEKLEDIGDIVPITYVEVSQINGISKEFLRPAHSALNKADLIFL